MHDEYWRLNLYWFIKQALHFFRIPIVFIYLGLYSLTGFAQTNVNQQPHDAALLEKLADSVNLLRNNNLQAAKQLCNNVISDSANHSPFLIGRCWEMLAGLHWLSGQLQDGIYSHRQARNYFIRAGLKTNAAYSLSNIGVYYKYTGERDSSMKYLLQSIEELKNTADHHYNALAHYNLGTTFSEINNFEKSIIYLEKAKAIASKNKDSAVLINTLQVMGKISIEQKNWRIAHTRLTEAVNYATALDRKHLQATISNLLSNVFLQLKNVDSALYFSKNAMHIANELNDIPVYVEACIYMAYAYEAIGNEPAKMRVLKKALAKEKEISEIIFGHGIYKSLAVASFKTGNYKRAYELLEIVDQLRELNFQNSSARLNTELEVKYQTAQKENTLSQQKLQLSQKDLQIQKSRNRFYIVLAGFLIASFLIIILIMQSRNKKLLHARQLRSVHQKKELQLLQALMQGEEKERNRIAKDLHDGVAGMLAAVKMHFSNLTPRENEVENQAGYRQGMKLLDEAVHEIRKTSHNLMPEVLLQHGLDKALARYCNSISHASTLLIQYDAIGNISRYVENFELSVYRMLQELLHNIIKHSGASEAIVQISEQYNMLAITIEDNGIGFDQDNVDATGMGLLNLQARVKALNGRMDLQTGIGSGVNVYLEFEIAELKKLKTTPV